MTLRLLSFFDYSKGNFKMMPIFAILVLAAASAGAQAQGPAATPAASAQATPSQPPLRPGVPPGIAQQSAAHPETVGATEAVITIHGLCAANSPSANAAACTTVVTKDQFENMLAAVNQTGQAMPPAAIRNLAERYVQLLAFANAAEKLGIDKDPKFMELLRVVRLNTLTETYHRTMEEKYRNPSDADIQAYYSKNIAKFEQVKLGRVFVPRINPKAPRDGLNDFEQRAQKVANELRDRAANGEDLDKLQQEAYKTLGLAPPSLSTDAGKRRRGQFPLAIEQEIWELKSGGITKVEPEPAGFQFYKLQVRETLPLAQAKNEIVAVISRENIEGVNKAVLGPIHSDLNETYFGARSTGAPLVIPPPRSRPTAPGNQGPTNPGSAAATPTPQGSAPPK